MNAPVDPSPVRIADRYVLSERIGAGAMGVVWLGTDELLNRTVAVKELLAAVQPGSANGDTLEEACQRILREGRIGARLQHPHVIMVFDVQVHDGRPWLVMEYLPSRSMAAVLAERGPLPPREAAEVGRQVADGLAAAHAAGVVHRDVKPGNVLLGDDGLVKITDFGVSRAVDDVQITRTGLIAGTPAFLAPEVARGRESTPAADVFALGATLYAAVEGRPPFGLDENAFALLHKVATGEVDPPRQSGPLTAVIMRLLAADPGERPSAAQAREMLAAVAAGAASLGPTPAATAVLDRGVLRRRGGPRPRAAAPATMTGPPPRAAGPATMTGPPARPEPRSRPSRKVPPALLVLFGVLLLGGGGAAVLVTNGLSRDLPASSAPDPTTRPRPTTQAPPPGAVVEDPVGFVQSYYGLLPDDTEAAFAQLSPEAQRDSGGFEGFDDFWDDYEDVSVQDPRVDGNTVTATIVFDPKDGPDDPDRYSFLVGTDDDGNPIIEDFDLLD